MTVRRAQVIRCLFRHCLFRRLHSHERIAMLQVISVVKMLAHLSMTQTSRGPAMRLMDIPEVALLSTAEKILLVEELWDNIGADPARIPVPDSHKRALDRRWEAHQGNPGSLISLDELKRRIEERK
jgi:putative addiction module component (TIGR02574 family)